MYSDEEDDYSSAEEGSDSEPMLEDHLSHQSRSRLLRKGRMGGSSKGNTSSAAAARQRNIKQKFVALLKKFKVTEPGDLEHECQSTMLDQKLEEGSVDPTSYFRIKRPGGLNEQTQIDTKRTFYHFRCARRGGLDSGEQTKVGRI